MHSTIIHHHHHRGSFVCWIEKDRWKNQNQNQNQSSRLAMKGAFSAPGDYVHFKSQVPLHKIPVCSFLDYSKFTTVSAFVHNN